MRKELPFVVAFALLLLITFSSLAITEIAEERTKRECIRAGMEWKDNNCVSALDTGGDQ